MSCIISPIEKYCISCIYFCFLFSFNDALNKISLYALIPSAFILCLTQFSTRKYNGYIITLFVLYAWIAISSIWAVHTDLATRQLHQIVGVVMMIVIIAKLASNKAIIPYLYFAYIIAYGAAWYYAQSHILSVLDISIDRMSDDKLNANTLAYYTFYYTFSTFICVDLVDTDKWKRFFTILFFISIPLSFYTAIMTGSRQVLVLQIPLTTFCLFQRYVKLSTRSLVLLGVIFVALYFLYKIFGESIYDNSILKQRNDEDVKDDVRMTLLSDAFNVGLSHLFTGVGAGNFMRYTAERNFSHCTYLELFANTGIVGVILFIQVIYRYIKNQYLRYRSTDNRMFISFLMFGLFFSFDNVFYVFYPDMLLISFFVLVLSHSESYWYNYNLNINRI